MRLLPIAIFAAAVSLAFQANASPKYSVLGQGTSTCGQWTEKRAHTEGDWAFLQKAWVLGFISGYNFAKTETTNLDSHISDAFRPEDIYSWVDNYCRNNPLDSLGAAARKLIEKLETETE
jgi:hypothetical protein